jgi:hypothetical protein
MYIGTPLPKNKIKKSSKTVKNASQRHIAWSVDELLDYRHKFGAEK